MDEPPPPRKRKRSLRCLTDLDPELPAPESVVRKTSRAGYALFVKGPARKGQRVGAYGAITFKRNAPRLKWGTFAVKLFAEDAKKLGLQAPYGTWVAVPAHNSRIDAKMAGAKVRGATIVVCPRRVRVVQVLTSYSQSDKVVEVLTSYSPPGMRMAHSKKVVAEARERRTKAEARRELGAYNRETLICRADGCHVVCAGRKALWKHRADKHA